MEGEQQYNALTQQSKLSIETHFHVLMLISMNPVSLRKPFSTQSSCYLLSWRHSLLIDWDTMLGLIPGVQLLQSHGDVVCGRLFLIVTVSRELIAVFLRLCVAWRAKILPLLKLMYGWCMSRRISVRFHCNHRAAWTLGVHGPGGPKTSEREQLTAASYS